MNKAEKLYEEVIPYLKDFDWDSVDPYFDGMGEIMKQDVINGPLYRAFIVVLCRLKKPKQVVELGGWIGKTSSVILGGISKKSRVIVVEINEELPRLTPKDSRLTWVTGDDLDLSIYPPDIDLNDTDIWFIDSNHDKNHMAKEFKLYKKFWKPGTILLLDDIDDEHVNLKDYWKEISYDKYNAKDLHSPHGFGVVVV